MSVIQNGQAHVAARARLMIQLGEQLITDEIAAVSELVKNAYDADATKVVLSLESVSDSDNGWITIWDNGHGMTLQKVLTSWLELGTLSKARGKDLKPRVSEFGSRPFLGEKGLGRLSVHKLGYITELVTRRIDEDTETKLVLDWGAFEDNERFIDEIPVQWEVSAPTVFIGPKASGTQITIKKLQRVWTREMLQRVQRGVMALKSPFSNLTNFNVSINIDDKLASELDPVDIAEIVKNATYRFEATIDEFGSISYDYTFNRPDLAGLNRAKRATKDIREPKHFFNNRKPTCGSFKVKFYAWELRPADLKAVFGDTAIYREIIRPNTGVKVYRDGFRVLPYGNTDNDWLSLDLSRVKRFELHISRNMIIGAIEISSEHNTVLLDKTDREGLIDNNGFKDFKSLILSAIAQFEAERYIDRRKLKEATGRIIESPYKATFSRDFVALSRIISSGDIPGEAKIEANRLIEEAREAFDKVLVKNESPLLVAASIGLTYMMPTHEVQRDLHDALKILRKMRDSKEMTSENLESAIFLIKQADAVVRGIGKLMQQSTKDDMFDLVKVARTALDLMQFKFKRNDIEFELIAPETEVSVSGSSLLTEIMLVNFLDNSFYWLQRSKIGERKIRVFVIPNETECMLIVSDNGPGFEDDISIVTLPFFTRKPNGMGLGLYIADRIAKMCKGNLKIFSHEEVSDLLPGASIGAVLKRVMDD